jgi:hypothetical protein
MLRQEIVLRASCAADGQEVTSGLINFFCADATVGAGALTDFRHYFGTDTLRCGGTVWHRPHIPI